MALLTTPFVASLTAGNLEAPSAAQQALQGGTVQTTGNIGLILSDQKIKIKLPSPPLGSTTAKVVVENIGNTTIQSEEEVYFDYIDSCTTPAKPTLILIPRVSQSELETSYDQCIELVADLYCSPVTSSLDIPVGETPDPTVREYRVQDTELYPGDQTLLLFNLEGIGFFQLFQTAQGQSLKIAEDSFNLPDEETIKIKLIIPSVVPPNVRDIQYSLVVKNKDGENIAQQPAIQTVIIKRQIIPPPAIPKNEIKIDNDFGDAKKERYHMLNFVPGLVAANESLVIDKNILNYKNTNLNLNENIGSYVPSDLFRENVGSFYMMNEQETDLVWAKNKNNTNIVAIDPSSIRVESKIDFSESREGEGFRFLHEKFNYSLPLELTVTQSNLLKDRFITRDKESAVIDFSYSYLKPYTEKEFELVGEKALNSSIIKQHSEYNFYNRKYEEIHYGIDEFLLPNMYFIAFNREGVDATRTQTREDDIEIDPDIRKALTLEQNGGHLQNPVDIKMYYDFYVKESRTKTITDQNLIGRIKNTYVTYDFLEKIEQYNSYSEMHPMKIELSFTKPRYSFISKILKDSEIRDKIMIHWLAKFQDNETEVFDSIKEEFDGTGKKLFASKNRYIDVTDSSKYTMKTPSANGSPFGQITLRTQAENFIFLGNYTEINRVLIERNIAKAVDLRKQLAYLLSRKVRTYSEILEGKKCHRETLYYRIAKFAGDPATSEPIQNIYLPNDPDRNSLKYIDTQVKYDKQYTYVIYTYDIVIGNEYFSDTNNTERQTNIQSIKNYPKLFLVENIFDQIEAKVKDRPPVSPLVNIHSYKDIDNQVLFLLGKSSNTIKKKEIIIKQGDAEIFEQVRRAQNLSDTDLIEFSGDDIIKKYEIFRLESTPRSYSDFEKAKVTEVSTLLDPADPDKRSDAVFFRDMIVPNKKYYYTFRCTDIHDQISNPTEIYEVKMINETGTIFLLWDIFKFGEQNDKQASKSMKRFLMIKPDFLQETFAIEPGNSKNKEELGQKITTDVYSSQDKSIWNKKYKLRLVSKSTNKVYDVNFKFGVETKIIE